MEWTDVMVESKDRMLVVMSGHEIYMCYRDVGSIFLGRQHSDKWKSVALWQFLAPQSPINKHDKSPVRSPPH